MQRLLEILGFKSQKKVHPEQEDEKRRLFDADPGIKTEGFGSKPVALDPNRLKSRVVNWPETKTEDGVTKVILNGQEFEYPPIFIPETYSFNPVSKPRDMVIKKMQPPQITVEAIIEGVATSSAIPKVFPEEAERLSRESLKIETKWIDDIIKGIKEDKIPLRHIIDRDLPKTHRSKSDVGYMKILQSTNDLYPQRRRRLGTYPNRVAPAEAMELNLIHRKRSEEKIEKK